MRYSTCHLFEHLPEGIAFNVRTLQEVAAARWFWERYEAQGHRWLGNEVSNLLFHEGKENSVRPYMRGVAAWLAPRVPEVLNFVTECEPETLLTEVTSPYCSLQSSLESSAASRISPTEHRLSAKSRRLRCGPRSPRSVPRSAPDPEGGQAAHVASTRWPDSLR